MNKLSTKLLVFTPVAVLLSSYFAYQAYNDAGAKSRNPNLPQTGQFPRCDNPWFLTQVQNTLKKRGHEVLRVEPIKQVSPGQCTGKFYLSDDSEILKYFFKWSNDGSEKYFIGLEPI